MVDRPGYLAAWRELAGAKGMILMPGPRQAGKTTFARQVAASFATSVYFNWDIVSDRARFIRDRYFFEGVERRDARPPLVVFDELHKYKEWKNYLKGVYDRFHDQFRFLVTGSGRLDAWRRGGDSLAGRYLLLHLWPFSLAELAGRGEPPNAFWDDPQGVAPDEGGAAQAAWERLSRFSGFPEPYVAASPAAYRRWSATYHSQVVREDLRDLTRIASATEVETLCSLLPERVGSLLSINALAEDLKVAFNTVRHWLDALERLYLVFTIAPWTRSVARATQKARKLYLVDYGLVENRAARFENMVALELLRAVTLWNDLGLGPFSLHFVRNKEKEEADFLITEKRRPRLLVETKAAETRIDPALRKFQDQLGVPAVHLLDSGTTYRKISNGAHSIVIAPAPMWLTRLPR
jgi:predicted AAA+ superfamily ATPase